MRKAFIRFQLGLVSVLLLATFVLLMIMVMNFNHRWDFTKQKIYSLSPQTIELLKEMKTGKLEIFAFYPYEAPQREEFELLLKQSQSIHSQLSYVFYDPEKRPHKASFWKVKEAFTVVFRWNGQTERLIAPDEELFATTLLKLKNPKTIPLCFTQGNSESSLTDLKDKGLSQLGELLGDSSFEIRTVSVGAGKRISKQCKVVVVAGPQKEWPKESLVGLKDAFYQGQNILFLIDPMDRGAGRNFYEWMRDLGVYIGNDVIVDKMSRVVGGDFLVPFVTEYNQDLPLLKYFEHPTFFPVARTVEPSINVVPGLKATSLAFTGSNSWAETQLDQLEKGDASFDASQDVPGPISIAVHVEQSQEDSDKTLAQMVVIGDSDFLTNAYLSVSGNRNLALRLLHELAGDDRVIKVENRYGDFQPLQLTPERRQTLFLVALAVLPLLSVSVGFVVILWRKRRQ